MGININGNDFTDMNKATEYFEKKKEEYMIPFDVIKSETARQVSIVNLEKNSLSNVLRGADEMIKSASSDGKFSCLLHQANGLNEEDSTELFHIFKTLGYNCCISKSGLVIQWY